MHAPSAAVVLVTHRTRDEVLGALATLDPGLERVVVDTGSDDGTPAAVRAAHPDVRVLELANAGYARGANAGVRVTTAPVVVVANADVRFAEHAVARLRAVLAADPTLGVVGPQVVDVDGRHQASARTLPDLRTAVGHALFGRVLPANPWTRRYHEVGRDPALPRDVDWVSGCALALSRAAFEDVDGFDPGYPLYVEDVDLCLRLRDAGWRVRYEPGARVAHRGGASSGGRRLRALVWHARGLDRLVHRRRDGGLPAAVLRPALWVALTAWVVLTWAAERALGASRRGATGSVGSSTTPELRPPADPERDP